MAALGDRYWPARSTSLLDLRELDAVDLEAMLAEEEASWREHLAWDFDKSADLVRRFVDMRSLSGFALLAGGEVAGYTYYVLEEQKGLVGDLYVMREHRTEESENRLLAAAVDALIGMPTVRRIESQLMMASSERTLPAARFASTFDRSFMVRDLRADALAAREPRTAIFVERWSDAFHDAAAQLIADAYRGHVDARINDQYRNLQGARRFLYNIVQYPGCGSFFRPGSLAAFETRTGRLCGMCLAGLVSPAAGHITQVCVGGSARGTGVGYELLRQSLEAMRAAGCRQASLTVTTENASAVELYRRMGFRTTRHFGAFVWEGF